MSRRSRKSKRRLNSLLWMLLLTAMLVTVSTYAWFSANKLVSLDSIHAKVSAAEGLQISLDGENWVSTISFAPEQNSASVVPKALLETGDGTGTGTSTNKYNWPAELIPVSTDGHSENGDVIFYAGEVSSDGECLKAPAPNTTNFISFDLYFKNASSQATGDNLELNVGSMIQVTNEALRASTGLEYSARAALLVYGNSAAMTALATDVRALSAGTGTQTTIWEPNYDKHIQEVVNNDDRVAATNSNFITKGIKNDTTTDVNGVVGIHGINASTVEENSTCLADQVTLRTEANLQAKLAMTDTASANVVLPANKIIKTRVYIWLEGQDPDCIDTASTGQALDFILNFTKPDVAPSGT